MTRTGDETKPGKQKNGAKEHTLRTRSAGSMTMVKNRQFVWRAKRVIRYKIVLSSRAGTFREDMDFVSLKEFVSDASAEDTAGLLAVISQDAQLMDATEVIILFSTLNGRNRSSGSEP